MINKINNSPISLENERGRLGQRTTPLFKSYLFLFFIVAIAGIAGAMAIPLASAELKNFSIVVIPDTQTFTTGEFPKEGFINQIDWIINNTNSSNIKMVLHVGDLVENTPNINEWEFAMGQMKRLDGIVPYLITAGNHDIQDHHYENFLKFVGKLVDYKIVEDINIGFLSIIDCPDHQVNEGWIDQANQILKENNETPFVVLTHNYLYTGNRYSPCYREVYDKLIKNNSNVFMVQGGHDTGELESYKNRTNENETSYAYEFLIDYQNDPTGFFRIFDFIPEQNLVKAKTFASPNITLREFNFTYKMNPYLFPNYTYWNETFENWTIEQKNITEIILINETEQTNITFYNESIYNGNYTVENYSVSYLDYYLSPMLSSYVFYDSSYPAPEVAGERENSGGSSLGSSGGGGGGGGSISVVKDKNQIDFEKRIENYRKLVNLGYYDETTGFCAYLK